MTWRGSNGGITLIVNSCDILGGFGFIWFVFLVRFYISISINRSLKNVNNLNFCSENKFKSLVFIEQTFWKFESSVFEFAFLAMQFPSDFCDQQVSARSRAVYFFHNRNVLVQISKTKILVIGSDCFTLGIMRSGHNCFRNLIFVFDLSCHFRRLLMSSKK